ncbi:MAG: guanylate kinase [Clostridiales bacterium]|nr:guanylate kinase [Clostridiales bacterium]
MPKGTLFIVSGPSGSGKDTVLGRLLALHPEVRLSISSITRPMREGEREGEKYHFISREEFEALLAADALLEHNVYLGNYYGTPRRPVEEALAAGRDIILEIDVNGADKVRDLMPEAVSVFIMPPSLAALEQRLSGRGTEDAATVRGRLKEAVGEIARAASYDYIVVNDDLDEAVACMAAVIVGERAKIHKQKYLIDEVLQDVESRNW